MAENESNTFWLLLFESTNKQISMSGRYPAQGICGCLINKRRERPAQINAQLSGSWLSSQFNLLWTMSSDISSLNTEPF